ncbi:MAG: FkbM family methyltransferase [Terriglobales bacterium]
MTATHPSAISSLEYLEVILRRIQEETPGAVRARERSAFDDLARPLGERLVLFGAGPLGKSVLSGLRQAGVEPLAFADNKRDLWDQRVMGLPVLSAAKAAEQYGKTACFVVTIYQGSSVRRQLTSLGCQRVVACAPLLWKYADVFIPQCCLELPHRLVEHCDSIRQCYASLADERSKTELREQLLWRYWLDFSALSPPLDASDTYFPMDLLSPVPDEVFVDCGSFDGESTQSFNRHWAGQFRHVFALEPDAASRGTLTANLGVMGIGDRATVMPYAVGDSNGQVSFASSGSVTSHITTQDAGSKVECRRLDDIEWPLIPTYIKMDIEGAEPQALAGGTELLRRHLPVLAVCTYHRSEHLWQIPNLIRSISPDYHLFLRRYAEECWEGVCYAVPSRRLKRA